MNTERAKKTERQLKIAKEIALLLSKNKAKMDEVHEILRMVDRFLVVDFHSAG